MIKKIQRIVFLLIGSMLLFSCNENKQTNERKINFEKDWKFHLGNIEDAYSPSYNDSDWRVLDLPHDWSVEPLAEQKPGITIGPFSRESIGSDATGQTVGGEGWYRKTFTISSEDADKLHTLYFEGAYNQSEVFVNGEKVYFNPYGYTSFKCDITKYCLPAGQTNTIAVKVVNEGKNSRWYAGSGIYRHVWLIKTNPIHLDEWTTAITTPTITGDKADISINTTVWNKSEKNEQAKIVVKISSPDGKEVASHNQEVSSTQNKEENLNIHVAINNPILWSIENPALYTAEITLNADNKEVDKISIPFGIRTISFSAEEGFLLNGVAMKLKGACIHHDNGLLGAKSINRAEEKKIEWLKANGFNAVRCAHNIPAEHFLAACDRMGILVIDEAFDQWQRPKNPQDYHRFFDEWSEKDLSAMLMRDRNHPSIIMWSIGNEIADRSDSMGVEIAQRLKAIVRSFDETRPVTAAINQYWDNPGMTWEDSEKAFRHLDVGGYNYMWHQYENDHNKYPHRIMYGSESVPKEAAENWNLVEKYPYIIGDFVWTGIDYLGEAGLANTLELAPDEWNPQFMPFPWYNGWCGDIDLCGDKKPQSYYRDILWREREISLAVQAPLAEGKVEKINYWGWKNELLNWNWEGLEGQPMTVNVYSRSPKVRLYLNDELIGEKETASYSYSAIFTVPYTAGELKAVNVSDDKETNSATLQTAGAAASIRLTADKTSIKANRDDLAYINIAIVDNEGRVIPNSNKKISLVCSGNGTIVASGNGAPDDMESFNSLTPALFRGKGIAILQPNETAGEIVLTVSSEGLSDSTIRIKTTN